MAANKFTNSMGYVVLSENNELEHRFIAMRLLNRELQPNEVVHHINGKKDDNEIKNLCVMDSEKHEYFHSWLVWKKTKSGSYPSINQQKNALENEYGGILLEKIAPDSESSGADNKINYDDMEIFLVRRNKSTKKAFIEFEEEFLISPEGREIEIDTERFGDLEEAYECELTEKQIQLYQNKVRSLETKAIIDSKQIELQKRLFNELRKERKRIAHEAGIPAYLVFDDKTLIEMSEIMPDTESMMFQVSGVGSYKLQLYGANFLVVIIKFKRKLNAA